MGVSLRESAVSASTFAKATALLLLIAGCGRAPEPPVAEEVVTAPPRFSDDDLERIRGPIAEQVSAGAFPGAAVAVGVGASASYTMGIGAIGWTRNAPSVDPAVTRYDLASLTKVVATAAAVMLLVDDGRMGLDDPVSRYLPEFAAGPKSGVTIRHMLTHTAGLPAGAVLNGKDRAERIARAKSFSIYPPPGVRVEYSDIGFVLLWEAAEVAAGEPLTGYLERRLYGPLGMSSTGFSPGLDCEECAPTGRLRDQSLYRGKPFDPLGQRLDGVTGSSGLFSTAHDLGRFAAMIANGGELDGVRVLSRESVDEFIGVQPVAGSYRLGWESVCDGDEESADPCPTVDAIGHTGWTGTAIYIDPPSGTWLVLLTNRTYEPRADNPLRDLRSMTLRTVLELGTRTDRG